MTRYERESAAKKWTQKMADMYSIEIKESIEDSTIYTGVSIFEDKSGCIPMISVIDETTEKAIHNISGKVGALNFASFKYPGGGFIKGSMAQEEALCHASTLYNVISADEFKYEYEYNRSGLNDGLYEDWAIYSPRIIFPIDEFSDTACDILTCPAPNRSASHASAEKYRKVLESRIKFVLDIFSKNNLSTVVLGAFGCGVFGNNPIEVAEIFKKELLSGKYNIKNVIFAIPAGPNLEAFKKVYGS